MSPKRFRKLFTAWLVLTDATMVTVAFVAAYRLRVAVPWPDAPANVAPFRDYLGLLAAQVLGVLAVFYFYRLYHVTRATSRIDQFYAIFGGVSIGTLLSVSVSSLAFKNSVFEVDYPRVMIVYAWVLAIVLTPAGRLVLQRLRSALQRLGIGQNRVLVVGSGEPAATVLEKIQWSPYLGYRVLGVVATDHAAVERLNVPVLGRPEDLPHLIDEHQVDEVILALPEASHETLLRLIGLAQRDEVAVKVFPDVFEIIASEVTIDDLGGLPLLNVRDVALRGWRLSFKRSIDVLGSAVGLVLCSPLMLLTALLIKLDSPGPAFYVQERMGLDARPFWMLKFRSMRADADADGPGWTVPGDPRRTRLGGLLRRLSIDELPNLINVLMGEMSLVGPRAEQPAFVQQFQARVPRYMERHRERAGITGWAQVNGLRGDTSIDERTKYDLWYIENWSIWLDLKIIVRTVLQIFSDRNAY